MPTAIATSRSAACRFPPQSGRELATTETTSAAVGACARCHGDERNAPASALVPLLHGQPAEFLAAALQAYAGGRRASGIMQPVAGDLGAAERDRVARYYAGLPPPRGRSTYCRTRPRRSSADAALAEQGDRGREDSAVHRLSRRATRCKTYPRLAGQNAAYMANRLRLWKGGLAPGTDGEAIMAPIARALNERQIEDVAAYFAALGSAPRRAGR